MKTVYKFLRWFFGQIWFYPEAWLYWDDKLTNAREDSPTDE